MISNSWWWDKFIILQEIRQMLYSKNIIVSDTIFLEFKNNAIPKTNSPLNLYSNLIGILD